MDLNENHRKNADEESHECKAQDSRDKLRQMEPSLKQFESSHNNQSRSNSRAMSIGRQSQTGSNPQTIQIWNSTNPFINFMSDFRKKQPGETSTNIFRLGGEQWRNMTDNEKQPFVDAANKNKKPKELQSSIRNQRKIESNLNKQQPKTDIQKDITTNKNNSSQNLPSPKKRKRSKQRYETRMKKKLTKSDSEADTNTDTSGSIHTATTDCASEESDGSP